MAKRKLWTDRRTAIVYCGAAILSVPTGCVHREPSIGLTLEFYNRGSRPLATRRFDFDGNRGPIPGYLGPGGEGAQMSFMPGDINGGIPKSVEAEWILHSEEYTAWSKNTSREEKYSNENEKIYKKLWAANPHYTQRVDLAPILTQEIIRIVRADRLNTQLKMIVIFRDGNIEITANAHKWR